MRPNLTLLLKVGVLCATVSSIALAEDAEPVSLEEEAPAAEPSSEAPSESTAEAPASSGSEEQKVDSAEAVEDALDTGSTEVEGKQYMFVGARYRNVIIPKFIQNAFADGGETVSAHAPGLEFVIRQDKFEYELFAMLGFYGFENVPFKGADDPDNAWELLDADYQILFLGADFMWSTDDFTPGLSLMYGAGAGLGVVFGELVRTQSYPEGGTTDPYQYVDCPGVGAHPYCDTENDHYNGFVEPSWTDGGSSPLFFPWIAANLGLRYKFNRQVAARLDAGLMLTGAFFGLGVDFGL